MEDPLWQKEESSEPWQLYGTWPGGSLCALTTDDGSGQPSARLPLYVWTREGERQTFVPYVAGPTGLN